MIGLVGQDEKKPSALIRAAEVNLQGGWCEEALFLARIQGTPEVYLGPAIRHIERRYEQIARRLVWC